MRIPDVGGSSPTPWKGQLSIGQRLLHPSQADLRGGGCHGHGGGTPHTGGSGSPL